MLAFCYYYFFLPILMGGRGGNGPPSKYVFTSITTHHQEIKTKYGTFKCPAGL